MQRNNSGNCRKDVTFGRGQFQQIEDEIFANEKCNDWSENDQHTVEEYNAERGRVAFCRLLQK